MFDFSNPETVWLNVTNLSLGLVTLVAVVGVGIVLAKELWGRLKVEVPSTGHTLVHPELGLTMADGGEPVQHEPARDSSPARKTSA
jgi:hypothetical protein